MPADRGLALFALTGKVALITGSSRGIGRAIAEAMAALGAKVVISSRKADACEAVAKDIRAQGGDAHVVPCNVSRKDEVENLVAETKRHYGADRHPGLQCRGQPGLRAAARSDRRGLRQDHGRQRQEQSVALQFDHPRHGQARRRRGRSSSRPSPAFAAPTSSAPTASPNRPISRWRAIWRWNGARRTCAPIASRPGW